MKKGSQQINTELSLVASLPEVRGYKTGIASRPSKHRAELGGSGSRATVAKQRGIARQATCQRPQRATLEAGKSACKLARPNIIIMGGLVGVGSQVAVTESHSSTSTQRVIILEARQDHFDAEMRFSNTNKNNKRKQRKQRKS